MEERDRYQFRLKIPGDVRAKTVIIANCDLVDPKLKATPSNESRGLEESATVDCTELLRKLKTNKQLINIGNKQDDSGSDTDNSQDEIAAKEMRKVLPQTKSASKKKKKKLTSDTVRKKGGSMSPLKRDDTKPTLRSDAADVVPEVTKVETPLPHLKINKAFRPHIQIPKDNFDSQRELNNYTEEDDENTSRSPMLSPQRKNSQSIYKLHSVESTSRDWSQADNSGKYQMLQRMKVQNNPYFCFNHFYSRIPCLCWELRLV